MTVDAIFDFRLLNSSKIDKNSSNDHRLCIDRCFFEDYSTFQFIRLIELDIWNFSDIPDDALNNMSNLEALKIIHQMKFSGFKFELKGLVKLKWLQLLGLDNYNLPEFEHPLPNLEVLEINLDFLEEISSETVSRMFQNFHSNIPKLKAFSFSYEPKSAFVDFDLKWLENFRHEINQSSASTSQPTSNLIYLSLKNIPLIKGSFTSFVNLRTLEIKDEWKFDRPFKFQSRMFYGLENLKSLNLSDTTIDGTVPDLFFGLFNLEKLNMSDCYMETLPDDFFSPLINLKVLNLYRTYIPFCSGIFNGLVNLKSLILSMRYYEENNHRFPIGLFTGLVNLEELDLSFSRRDENLTKEIPFENLKKLILTSLDLTEEFIEQIKVEYPNIVLITKFFDYLKKYFG